MYREVDTMIVIVNHQPLFAFFVLWWCLRIINSDSEYLWIAGRDRFGIVVDGAEAEATQ